MLACYLKTLYGADMVPCHLYLFFLTFAPIYGVKKAFDKSEREGCWNSVEGQHLQPEPGLFYLSIEWCIIKKINLAFSRFDGIIFTGKKRISDAKGV